MIARLPFQSLAMVMASLLTIVAASGPAAAQNSAAQGSAASAKATGPAKPSAEDQGYSYQAYLQLDHKTLAHVAHTLYVRLAAAKKENQALRLEVAHLKQHLAAAPVGAMGVAAAGGDSGLGGLVVARARQQRLKQLQGAKMAYTQQITALALRIKGIGQTEDAEWPSHNWPVPGDSGYHLFQNYEQSKKRDQAAINGLNGKISGLGGELSAIRKGTWNPLINPRELGAVGMLSDSWEAQHKGLSFTCMQRYGKTTVVVSFDSQDASQYPGTRVYVTGVNTSAMQPGQAVNLPGRYKVIGRRAYRIGQMTGTACVLARQKPGGGGVGHAGLAKSKG